MARCYSKSVLDAIQEKVRTAYTEGKEKPLYIFLSRQFMAMTNIIDTVNDVNGMSNIRGRHVASGFGGHKASGVVIMRNPCTNIATWNVRTMLKDGKLENIQEEMKRNKISILGLSETRWKNSGDFENDGYRILYSGGNKHERGVAVVIHKDYARRITKIVQHSDRIILVKVEGDPADIIIIQVYMPTSQHDEAEIDQLYDQIEKLIDEEKGSDHVVIMGDFNAVVGEGREDKEVGSYGLGIRNDRGDKLVEFCKRRKFVVTNTWFKQEKRRRYTWKAPEDIARYQLDYILVRQRYRNSVKKSISYPGADADSDHNLVMMKTKIRMKKIKRRKPRKKWNLSILAQQKDRFSAEVDQKLSEHSEGTINEKWLELKASLIDSAKRTIGFKSKREPKKPWITEDMIKKMKERRTWKTVSTAEGRRMYRKLNNELRRETEQARDNWWKAA